MDIVELALTMKKCEELKAVLVSQQSFATFEEFKQLLALKAEKEELKQAEVVRLQE